MGGSVSTTEIDQSTTRSSASILQVLSSRKSTRERLDSNCQNDTSAWWRFQWCPCSKPQHRQLEKSMLESVKTPYKFQLVNVGVIAGTEDSKIWTLVVNETSNGIPLVLLHGFASGLALWALNLDQLAEHNPVYSIDILGFGGSARPQFSTTSEEVEAEFVLSIERWRIAMGLGKIVLVGHSFGGFLCTLYSIEYPESVEHLILADPWGFKERPNHVAEILNVSTPLLILLRIFVPLNFTPLWSLRLFGRLAPALIQYFRQDLIQNFVPDIKNANHVLSNYIFQCNARDPTGEAAFNCLMSSFGWAKNPLNNRIHNLDEDIPLTVIYGTKSWIDHVSAEEIHANRGGAFVDTHLVEGCGHHVYTENRPIFNKIVLQACLNTKSRNRSERKLEESQCCNNDCSLR